MLLFYILLARFFNKYGKLLDTNILNFRNLVLIFLVKIYSLINYHLF